MFNYLQKIGKSLMLPIAVLPIAALMLRFGAPDLLNIAFINKAGAIIFDNLPLIFAIGVAIGISKDGAGAAGLAGAIGYLTMTAAYGAINDKINMGVIAGIIAGCLAGALYNKFHNIKVPNFLGFFGGKRFVPIITGICSLILALFFGYLWPPVQDVIHMFGEWLTRAGAFGVGIYGICNALLLPFGLHHVLNSLVWFVFGTYTNPETGKLVSGDLFRYFAGDPTAGSFMAGFYPIFMFGMVAAAIAMYKCAKPENKSKVGGVLFSAALTFALTGIGEPLLFTFCFAAPVLYLVHSILQGSSFVIVYLMGIKHGFGFSAGLIDYVLNFGLSAKGWLIIPIGVVYFILYYFIFTFMIKKFNLVTPGRENLEVEVTETGTYSENEKILKYIEFLGGPGNFSYVEACLTRLRLKVNDEKLVNEPELKKIGVAGIMKVKNNIQVVVGTTAEETANEINNELKKINNYRKEL